MKLPALDHTKHAEHVARIYSYAIYTIAALAGFVAGEVLYIDSPVQITLSCILSFMIAAVVLLACKLRVQDYWTIVNEMTRDHTWAVSSPLVSVLYSKFSATRFHRKVLMLALHTLPVEPEDKMMERLFVSKECKLWRVWQKEWWQAMFRPVSLL